MKRIEGFTLIELMIIVAIIGILAAIVTTAINDANTNNNQEEVIQYEGE